VSDLNNNPEHSEFPKKSGKEKKQIQKKEFVEEYRLIPVDEYGYTEDEDYIDVIGLLKDLWVNRKTILTVASCILFWDYHLCRQRANLLFRSQIDAGNYVRELTIRPAFSAI